MRSALLKVTENGLLETVNHFLRDLLEKGQVDALLLPLVLPSGDNVVQSLVTGPDMLERANPLAPVLPVNTARIVSMMTKVEPSRKKIGVVLRSCELRAVVELVKLKQASLENLVLIGVDCFGTYSMSDFGRMAKAGEDPSQRALDLVKSGGEDDMLREACRVCEYPSPMEADLTIGLIGMDLAKAVMVKAGSETGEAILDALELTEEIDGSARQAAIEKTVAANTVRRDGMFAKTESEMSGQEKLLSTFALCINCHNCRDVCPICYCRECFFDSKTFDWGADKYIDIATRKEALKMPTDTLLFHLTRLNHMGSSCVGCGLCQEACPNEVPVFDIFRTVGQRVQDVFEYVPGRSLDEEMPLTTFREDELRSVGYE